MKKCFIFFLGAVFLLNSCLLYGNGPILLEALIEEAKEKNPDILAAKKRWEAAKLRAPQAKSLEAPTVGFSFMKIPKGGMKFDKTMPEDRMLSISQMFPLFGKLSLKEKIALIEAQMFAAKYKDEELNIVNRLKNAYWRLFMINKEISLRQENLRLLEAAAKAAEAKYITGKAPQDEISKINLEVAYLATRIENLKEESFAEKTHINTLLNRSPEAELGEPVLLEENFAFDEIKIEELYRLALDNQPELRMFSYAIEKNKHAESLAKRNFFPDLMAEVGLRGFSSGGIGPWDLMLAFTLPFWFWTKQRYEVKEAIVNLEEAQASFEAMKNKTFSQVKGLASDMEKSKNRIQLYKNNLIPILESSISSSSAAFRSGRGNFMVLLDTERMLIENKMEYYQALVDYNMNLADLERMVGISLNKNNSEGAIDEKK